MIALVRKEDFDSIAMMAIAMMPPPPTIMAIATALPRLLMAAAAPAMTWLPLNVVIVDNDRGDTQPHNIRRNSSVPLRRELRGLPRLAEATADLS